MRSDIRKNVSIRRDIRRYLSTGDSGSLETLAHKARAIHKSKVVWYNAVSRLLTSQGQGSEIRVQQIADEMAVDLDDVDKIVLSYAKGEYLDAIAAINELWELSKGRKRLSLWRVYMVSNYRMRTAEPVRSGSVRVLQYWDKNPPPDVARHMASWRELVGAERYELFDDERAREMISATIGADGVKAYDACWHPAMKSDFFRIVEIFRAGGLYIDADMRPTERTLQTLDRIDPQLHLTVQTQFPRCGIQNNVVGGSAGHRFFEKFVRVCIENVLTKQIRSPPRGDGTRCIEQRRACLLFRT